MTDQGVTCRGVALIGLSLWLMACASTQREMPSAEDFESQAVEASQVYRIGPMDVLQISVWQQRELNVPSLVVRLDGKISMPLVDDVQAAGLSALELKSVLSERLSEFITNPHVTVVVREINSKRIYVIGEVAREGPLVFQAEMRVVDAIASAGGFREFAGRNRVKIIRDRNGRGPTEFVFDYPRFVTGELLKQNILLLPGDRIVVPPERPFSW